MNYMTCTTCTRVVQVNCTGICLSCQRGFMGEPSEDALVYKKEQTEKLESRLEEIEKALEVPKKKTRKKAKKKGTK